VIQNIYLIYKAFRITTIATNETKSCSQKIPSHFVTFFRFIILVFHEYSLIIVTWHHQYHAYQKYLISSINVMIMFNHDTTSFKWWPCITFYITSFKDKCAQRLKAFHIFYSYWLSHKGDLPNPFVGDRFRRNFRKSEQYKKVVM